MSVDSESFPEIGTRSEKSNWFFNWFPLTVEPIIFVYFFLFSFTDGISTNVMISKACTVVYDMPFEQCYGKLDPEVEKLMQSYTTQITMIKAILESVLSGAVSIFVGSWSDINGRKPFIVIPVAGYTLYLIAWYLFIHLPTISPYWVLVPSLFFGFSGGLVSVLICVFAYITDVTNERNRAFRMVTIYSVMTMGIVGGYASSYFVYKFYGDNAANFIYSVASGSCFLILLYTIFVLPESNVPQQGASSTFFNSHSIKETWFVVFKYRPQRGTLILFLDALVIVIATAIINGDLWYRYFALRKSFDWTLEQYNIYSGIQGGVSVLASTIGSYISCSLLRVHDLYIALFVALTSALCCVLLALSRTSIEYYLFSVVGCFGLLLNPMLKAQISRAVDKPDLGKYFAFISTLEALVPLLTSPLYRSVYNAVLDIQPLYYFFVSASFWLLSSVIIIGVLLIQAFSTRNFSELLINADSNDISPNTSGVEVRS